MGLGLVDKPHLQRFKDKLDEYFVKKTDKGTSSNFGVVKVDGTTITSDGGVITAVGGGSEVTWTQTQSSGTKIAEIEIDGTSQDVYAPTPTTVEANPQGTATGTLTTLQVGADIYEVSGGGGSSTLADLTDTDITTPSDAQELVYDNTSSKWQNKTTKISLTQAEYDNLSYAEKHNGCIYYITDAGHGSNTFTPVGLGECYSEEERMMGCWTDGKPLYQKTINFGALPNNTTKSVAHNISNVDTIWVSGGFVYDTGDTTNYEKWGINRPSLNAIKYQWEATVNRTDVKIIDGENFSSFSAIITIQYTKTTDTAGSGAWTPSGVPAIHYSDKEQVIGTWIDGKTLYQKTVMPTITQISNHEYSDSDLSSADMQMIFDGYYVVTNNYLKMPLNQYESSSYYTRTGFRTDKTLYLYAVGYSVTDSAVITVRYTKS